MDSIPLPLDIIRYCIEPYHVGELNNISFAKFLQAPLCSIVLDSSVVGGQVVAVHKPGSIPIFEGEPYTIIEIETNESFENYYEFFEVGTYFQVRPEFCYIRQGDEGVYLDAFMGEFVFCFFRRYK